MNEGVHPTAVVDPAVEVAKDVWIGPFAVVGPHVRLGPGVRIHGHAMIEGHTELAEGVEVFPFAVIGQRPQDRKYDGTATRVLVGPRTVLREYVTVHPGSRDGASTSIGRDVLVMAYCHVAHDCRVGDGVTMANGVQLAGHCAVDEHAVLGGLTNVHQFARMGRFAMTGAATRISRDVLPYSLVDGHPARWIGLNVTGLRRAGFSAPTRAVLKRALRATLAGPRDEARDRLDAWSNVPEVAHVIDFVRASTRGLTGPRRRPSAPTGAS